MALNGVSVTKHRTGKAKGPGHTGSIAPDKGLVAENAVLKEAFELEHEKLQSYVDFTNQFEEIVGGDADAIKAACDELEIPVKGNTPQRDMLQGIFLKMKSMMLEPAE